MRLDKNIISKMKIEPMDENFQSEKYFYSHLIRHIGYVKDDKDQSWIHGKVIINFDKNKTKGYHFDYNNELYEKFIIGYDNEGNELLQDCRKEAGKTFVLTYFKKEVLNKYYNEP